jgi:sulfhydrogenase subunit alpha
VEAPRGILYHHYEYDKKGRIEGADDREIERLCAMLVRAYDPCVSSSVH